MAQPTNTYSSYDAVGNREDLSDIIYDVSPAETPFLSRIPRTTMTGTKHEWQTDVLASPSSTNFNIEGDDANLDATTATVRKYNYRAISDKTAVVTGSQEAVTKAGRKKEMAYQMARRMKELKKDVEAALLENNAHVAGNDTLASECAGAQAYIITNTSYTGTLATGDGTDGHTDGSAHALQESYLEAVLATAWSNGGSPTLGICNAFQKRKIATFSGSSTKTSNGDSSKVVNTVDIYIDPLGNEVKFVPCRQVPTDVVYAFDPQYIKFAVLRDFHSIDLAKTGDADKKQLIVEYTLEVCNEKAHAGIYDLSAS